ncbi:MAG TPA: biotin/lipoate--protein ligase family protein, partial [Stellaceae bacterium]|nr:biotin/lipoate--protein ligase family protein [Stellaceae bacterium]
ETAVPAWLVFGAMIRTVSPLGAEMALHPLATALAEEGFDDASAEALTERFARHLMVAIDRWQESGFAPIAREYRSKLSRAGPAKHDIVDNGDLLISTAGKPAERRSLTAALRAPSWLDPLTGGPLLDWPPAGGAAR